MTDEREQVESPLIEKSRALAIGMDEAEADCWVQVAEVARAFFRLEVIHPMDNQEVAAAIHVIQDKLLCRPAYRKYIASRDSDHEILSSPHPH